MAESSEMKPSSEISEVTPAKPTSKNSWKKAIAHGGFAVATTLSALIGRSPQEAHAQPDPIVQQLNYEQSEFNAQLTEALQKGKKVDVILGRVKISPEAAELDHFLSQDNALSESFKDAPFIDANGEAKKMAQEIDNPIVVKNGETKYLVYRNPKDQFVATILTDDNLDSIIIVQADKEVKLDKKSFERLETTQITAEGLAETNLEPNKTRKELFGKNSQGEWVMLGRNLHPQITPSN